MKKIQLSKVYILSVAFFAAMLWGGWAFYVNTEFGTRSRTISGVTQGSFSFLMTFLLTHIVALLYNKISNQLARIVLPPVLATSMVGAALVCLHIAVGTQAIFRTVLPSLTVALAFCIFTTIKLRRVEYYTWPASHREKSINGLTRSKYGHD